MGRRRLPAPSMSARYVVGPPKRIRVATFRPGAKAEATELSTREARALAASLLQAIDTAEADKIATRGDPTRKAAPLKRDGTRGLTKKREVRPPSRLKRVEAAAVNLHCVLSDLLGTEGAPLELISNNDTAGGLIVAALTELNDALGRRAGRRIVKPTGGPSR